jgi:pimeloyl-ACP methyl ester carboxylesterase
LAPEVSDIADRTARQFRRFADATGGDRRALAAAMRAPSSPLDDLGSIAVPALVAVGADDPLAVGPAALAGAIPGARLALTPGDHLAAPGQPEYAAAIVEFLRSVDALDRPT